MELDGYVGILHGHKSRALFLTSIAGPPGEITKEAAEKIFDIYVTRGGNFIDTANKVRRAKKHCRSSCFASFSL